MMEMVAGPVCPAVGAVLMTAFYPTQPVLQGHGYLVTITSFDRKESVLIGSSWTRGLAIHPVGQSDNPWRVASVLNIFCTATVFTAVALAFACSKSEHGPLMATLLSFLAAFLVRHVKSYLLSREMNASPLPIIRRLSLL
jgi:hypothetical protein